jgi:L-lactate dehydrogenase
VQQIIELQLADDEAEMFRHAIKVIKAYIARLP